MLRANPTALALALCALVGACDGDSSGDGARGRECGGDAQCGALSCVADIDAEPEDLAPLALVCGDASDAGAAGEPCEQEEDCEHGVCLLAGACARPCRDEDDCSEAERCQAAFARRGPDALQSLSACVAATDLPGRVSVERERLRDALEPPSARVDLDPVDADATTLYVLEHLDDNWPDGVECRPALCVRTLRTRDPAPVELFDSGIDYAAADAPLNPVATGAHQHPAVVMLPAGAASALSDAGYRLELALEHPGDLQLTRLSAAASSGGRLDLNVFYLGALDWAPEGDRGPPLLADALAVVDEIFAPAEIAIGGVRQIAVPGELPMIGTAFPDGDEAQGFAVLQPRFGVYVELPGLFRLSAGAGNAAINLFFVQEIEPLVAGGEPEAQAGGIPGPLGMHGTGASGIAISTDMMEGDAQMLGRTLAHEIAHFLGLFHTSERDGSVYEPLEDTPECRPEQDLDGDGLSAADCADHGGDNLMFWAKTTGTELSAEQRAVLKRALILR
jgi:hypothetical protein